MSSRAITLEQLIPCPGSLRLLVLHTPTVMNLKLLAACTNLVKLDLSNNSIVGMPYLGHLQHLRFMFLHNNRLALETLQQIFFEGFDPKLPRKREKTPLAESIAWTTYWGNRNEFQARHFLVSHTNVIAIDHNLVVEEERVPGIFESVQAFSPETLVKFPLLAIEERPERLTEDDYICYFHQELRILRRHHIKVNPIIRLQSLYRGYKVRSSLSIEPSPRKLGKRLELIQKFFEGWRKYVEHRRRLQIILKRRGKDHLMHDNTEMKKRLITNKLKQLARQARERVQTKKELLKMEYRIGRALMRNFVGLKSLYSYLRLSEYGKIYFHKRNLSVLNTYIIPLVEASSTSGGLLLKENTQVCLLRDCPRSFYERPASNIPFVQIVLPATASLILRASSKQSKLKKIADRLGQQHSIGNSQLVEITGSEKEVRDVLRTTCQFNLTNKRCVRLVVYPELIVRMVSSAIRIQKVWRGQKCRKLHNFKLQLQRQRSARRIQKWFRGLSYYHRSLFLYDVKSRLKCATASKFFIKLGDYLNLQEIVNRRRLKFLEQNVEVVRGQRSKEISLQWEASSAIPSVEKLIIINQTKCKPIFGGEFYKSVFGRDIGICDSSDKLVSADIYHLIHLNTKCTRVRVEAETYMMVSCGSLYEAKLRMFALSLLTYSFDKRRKIEINNKINYEGTLPQAQVIKPTNLYHLFLTPESKILPTTLEFCPEQKAKSIELTIYLKESPNAFPFRSSEKLKYVLCGVNPPTQKSSIQAIKTPTNKLTDLHIQSVQYEEHLNPTQLTKKISYDQTKKVRDNRRKSRLEDLGRKLLTFQTDNSSMLTVQETPTVRVAERTTEPSLLLLSPKSQLIGSVSDRKKRSHRMRTQASAVLDSSAEHLRHNPSFSIDRAKHNSVHLSLHKDRKSIDESNRFVSQFVNVSNFLSKEHTKTQLRSRHYRLQSEISELVQRNRQKERDGLEYARMRREQKLQEAKLSFGRYQEQLIESRQKGHESEVELRNIQMSYRADQKLRRLKDKERRKHSRLAFPEELYPMDSRQL